MSRDDEFTAFVRAHRPGLVRWGRSLMAGDRHAAEDLVQTSLTRVYLHWGRASDAPVAYARRTLVNAAIDHRRKPATRLELVTDDVPDRAGPPTADRGDGLNGALRSLPPRMRAAVVLRHVEGLSVSEAASVMACSEGTVKSQTARGLDKLRDQLDDDDLHRPATELATTRFQMKGR